MGDLSNFLANLKNYMSLEGEFRCCHLVFGVFCPQIHVFWGPMVKKSQISENDGHLRCGHHFRKFVNMVGTLCAERARRQFANFRKWWLHCGHHFWKFTFVSRHHFQNFMKTQKNGPFLQPKKLFLWWYFFVFQPGIYMDRWDLPKTAPDLVNLGPQSTVCNLHPDIWSHHPVLDFHTQITRYSTAMC